MAYRRFKPASIPYEPSEQGAGTAARHRPARHLATGNRDLRGPRPRRQQRRHRLAVGLAAADPAGAAGSLHLRPARPAVSPRRRCAAPDRPRLRAASGAGQRLAVPRGDSRRCARRAAHRRGLLAIGVRHHARPGAGNPARYAGDHPAARATADARLRQPAGGDRGGHRRLHRADLVGRRSAGRQPAAAEQRLAGLVAPAHGAGGDVLVLRRHRGVCPPRRGIPPPATRLPAGAAARHPARRAGVLGLLAGGAELRPLRRRPARCHLAARPGRPAVRRTRPLAAGAAWLPGLLRLHQRLPAGLRPVALEPGRRRQGAGRAGAAQPAWRAGPRAAADRRLLRAVFAGEQPAVAVGGRADPLRQRQLRAHLPAQHGRRLGAAGRPLALAGGAFGGAVRAGAGGAGRSGAVRAGAARRASGTAWAATAPSGHSRSRGTLGAGLCYQDRLSSKGQAA